MGAWITCPPAAIPAPGQALFAWAIAEPLAPRATPLFAADLAPDGFLAAAPLPLSWAPGSELHLRGPLGQPFRLPERLHRLALAALGDSVARLRPLLHQALAQSRAVALYTNAPLPALPTDVEIYPLNSLPEGIAWADFLACDLPLDALGKLRQYFGLEPGARLPCPAQALLLGPSPCGGLAGCGACAVPARRGWKLACTDGPVFDLNELEW